MTQKKIIFFDGDGTLWYPKMTKRREKPHWIYFDKKVKNPTKLLTVTPTTISTLTRLKKMGVILAVLSTHPRVLLDSSAVINGKLKHLKLGHFFDEVHATKEYFSSKGKFMVKILRKYGIPKSHALMVGDKYDWDYKPAQNNGIDALLMESDYEKQHPIGKKVKRTIKQLNGVFDYI